MVCQTRVDYTTKFALGTQRTNEIVANDSAHFSKTRMTDNRGDLITGENN